MTMQTIYQTKLDLLRMNLDSVNKSIKFLEECRKDISSKIFALRMEEYETSKSRIKGTRISLYLGETGEV